jgi:hypothetical protein
MKNRHIFVATAFTILSFILVTYTACRKDPCSGYVCYNNGVCSNGYCSCATGYTGYHCENLLSTYLDYNNNTYTPINITVDNQTHVIPVGSKITYTGSYGDQITGTAQTSGTTNTGAIVGEPIIFSFTSPFPISGTAVQELDVTSDYFFLQIVNNSPDVITKVYINYGLQSQTIDNITIPNDGRLYAVGYYYAFTNSTARFEDANGNRWTFNSLGLPFTSNQTVTLTAN